MIYKIPAENINVFSAGTAVMVI